MSKPIIITVVIAVLTAGAAWAQLPGNNDPGAMSPRQLSMGGAGLAIADDAQAWLLNPAGLSSLNIPTQASSFSSTLDMYYADWPGDTNVYNLNWAGFRPASHIGFGAGLSSSSGSGSWEVYGAGVGVAIKGGPFSVGLSVRRGANFDQTNIVAGGLYRGKHFNLGVKVDDVNNQNGTRFISPGAAFKVGNRFLATVDLLDLTGEWWGPLYCFGGEFKLSPQWLLRAGHMDTFFYSDGETFGLGYKARSWHADFGYFDMSSDQFWSAAVGLYF